MITIILTLVIVALAICLTIQHRTIGRREAEILRIEDTSNLNFRRGFDAGWEAGHREGERRKNLEWLEKTKTSSN